MYPKNERMTQALAATGVVRALGYKGNPVTIRPQRRTWPMDLQLLDFDCSEDTEGVVCWDALAQPQPRHNSALLHEVAQVLAWAHDFDAQGPGPLENGANWDFDLQATRYPGSQAAQDAGLVFDAPKGQIPMEAADLSRPLALSLSLSGTPCFAQAFRERWGTP
jgi:hypothetical protein